jgi:hypothetical protein
LASFPLRGKVSAKQTDEGLVFIMMHGRFVIDAAILRTSSPCSAGTSFLKDKELQRRFRYHPFLDAALHLSETAKLNL